MDAIQILVSEGHSWASIKDYTFSEIGSFLKVIVKQKAEKRAERLNDAWYAKHLKKSGLDDLVKNIIQSVTPKKTSQEEIQDGWNRLKGLRSLR